MKAYEYGYHYGGNGQAAQVLSQQPAGRRASGPPGGGHRQEPTGSAVAVRRLVWGKVEPAQSREA